MLGRRANCYTTAPELSQVASFSCFADLEFLSSVQMSKITEKFCMSGNFSGVSSPYFPMNKIFVQSIFINSMILHFLMLSRIELETFCVYVRRDNCYTTAPELSEVASFSCFADLEFYQQCICRKLRKILACLNVLSSRIRHFFRS